MDPRLLPFLAQQTAETQVPTASPHAPAPGSDGLFAQITPMLMVVGVIAFMYFFSIRPARKEEKRKKDLLGSLKKGDTVVTSSGILGSVHSIKTDTVILNIGDNARMEILRSAIQDVRGTAQPATKPEKEKSK